MNEIGWKWRQCLSSNDLTISGFGYKSVTTWCSAGEPIFSEFIKILEVCWGASYANHQDTNRRKNSQEWNKTCVSGQSFWCSLVRSLGYDSVWSMIVRNHVDLHTKRWTCEMAVAHIAIQGASLGEKLPLFNGYPGTLIPLWKSWGVIPGLNILSGKCLHNHGKSHKSPSFMGKSTISMAMFKSKLSQITREYICPLISPWLLVISCYIPINHHWYPITKGYTPHLHRMRCWPPFFGNLGRFGSEVMATPRRILRTWPRWCPRRRDCHWTETGGIQHETWAVHQGRC